MRRTPRTPSPWQLAAGIAPAGHVLRPSSVLLPGLGDVSFYGDIRKEGIKKRGEGWQKKRKQFGRGEESFWLSKG